MSSANWEFPKSAWRPKRRRNRRSMQHDDKASKADSKRPAPNAPNTPKPMNDWDDDEPAPTGFKKHRVKIVVGVLALSAVGVAAKLLSKAGEGGPVAVEPPPPMKINLVTPPPPATPQPTPPPQIEEVKKEMVEEDKPVETPPEDTSPPEATTALKGNGGPNMGLKQGNSGVFGNGRGTIGNPRQKWSAYASQLGAMLSQALKANPKTRKAAFKGVTIRTWLDSSGRVTRATINPSTGDSEVDAAIINEVAPRVQLPSPPPEGMDFPIVQKISAQRPN